MRMANSSITTDLITVHGRGSLVLPYKLKQRSSDGTVVQIDLSTRTIYFEVDGVPIRELLVGDPADPLGKLIVLENDQVVILKKSPTPYIIRDETDRKSTRLNSSH